MTRLRVGVAGLGIGQAHLLAYVLAPDLFEVVAIAETDAERRERGAADWGVPAVASIAELAALDLDVVDICTPPDLHEQHCAVALDAGRHVICEKPIVVSLDALARLERKAQSAAGVLMPVFQYRFAPGLRRLRAAMEAGLCGRLYLATSETSWWRDETYYSTPWRRSATESGGGAVFGHATHAHDLLTWIAGPLTHISGTVATLVNDVETEDTAAAFGRTADGAVVSMSVTLGSIRELTRLRFCFEHVTVESSTDPYEPGNEPWQFDWRTPDIAARAEAVWHGLDAEPDGYAGQLAAFHRAVTTGSPLPVTLADSRRALELVEAWYRSAADGRIAIPGMRS